MNNWKWCAIKQILLLLFVSYGLYVRLTKIVSKSQFIIMVPCSDAFVPYVSYAHDCKSFVKLVLIMISVVALSAGTHPYTHHRDDA